MKILLQLNAKVDEVDVAPQRSVVLLLQVESGVFPEDGAIVARVEHNLVLVARSDSPIERVSEYRLVDGTHLVPVVFVAEIRAEYSDQTVISGDELCALLKAGWEQVNKSAQ